MDIAMLNKSLFCYPAAEYYVFVSVRGLVSHAPIRAFSQRIYKYGNLGQECSRREQKPVLKVLNLDMSPAPKQIAVIVTVG